MANYSSRGVHYSPDVLLTDEDIEALRAGETLNLGIVSISRSPSPYMYGVHVARSLGAPEPYKEGREC